VNPANGNVFEFEMSTALFPQALPPRWFEHHGSYHEQYVRWPALRSEGHRCH
jgi:hypothetical protein